MKSSVQLTRSQGLRLTPQLQLAIKLLQHSRIDLEREIDNAIESNPFLERVDDMATEEVMTTEQTPDALSVPEWEEGTGLQTPSSAGGSAEDALEWIAETRSLRMHLLDQLQLCLISARDRRIGEALIDSLDDDGYLLAEFAEIQAATGLSPQVDDDEIAAVLHLLQQFDPLAVAARNLSECLLLQLRHLDAEPDVLELAKRIAGQYLDVLARSGVPGLVNATGFDPDLSAQAVGLLKTLDPKPGAAFSNARTEYVQPDFRAEKYNGRWKIKALGARRQQLTVNAYYLSLTGKRGGQDSAYLRQHLQEAKWLIKSIQSRQETLMRVVSAIATRQKPFLEYGSSQLQPMSMKDLAQQLDIHESTVSRACSGKYLATPLGTFALNALFRTGMADTEGQMQTADAIQRRIKALIEAEPPRKPFSDAQLERLLGDQGLSIARRTIAKYREAMDIAPSHRRHRKA